MSTSAGLLRRGAALYRSGEFVSALRAFERHLDAHHRDAEGWIWMARALFRLREMDGALAACDCALSLAPDHRAALALRERIAAERVKPSAPAKNTLELPPEAFELVFALIGLVIGQ